MLHLCVTLSPISLSNDTSPPLEATGEQLLRARSGSAPVLRKRRKAEKSPSVANEMIKVVCVQHGTQSRVRMACSV